MQAVDIDAPEMQATLGGKAWTLRFDNDMIRRTEITYAQAVGVQMGYLGILCQAERGIFGALCAMCYGAIASAEAHEGVRTRQRTSFQTLDAAIGYRELVDLGEDMVTAALRAIDAGRGNQKKTQA